VQFGHRRRCNPASHSSIQSLADHRVLYQNSVSPTLVASGAWSDHILAVSRSYTFPLLAQPMLSWSAPKFSPESAEPSSSPRPTSPSRLRYLIKTWLSPWLSSTYGVLSVVLSLSPYRPLFGTEKYLPTSRSMSVTSTMPPRGRSFLAIIYSLDKPSHEISSSRVGSLSAIKLVTD
jgi:hypothetical protein